MSQVPPSIEIAEMAAFVTVVDAGSFTRAAAELRVPRATVGRRLARLEEQLSTRLLRRTTRSLALTEAGAVFYRHARMALEAASRAEQSVRRETGKVAGSLRVSVPPMIQQEFLEFLTDFAERHPAVTMQVHFGTRHVDLLRDGYDVALRAGTVAGPGLVARKLLDSALVAVASPAYLERAGTPRAVKDLARHRALMAFDAAELPRRTWPTTKGEVPVEGAFFSNEMQLLATAALRGVGIAMVPERLVETELQGGELVQVLPRSLRVPGAVSIVYPEREFLPPQVRAFIDAIVAWGPALERAPLRERRSS